MPSSGESRANWVVPDVFLVTESKDGRVAVPHLHLAFVEDGIEVSKHNGEAAWDCKWDDLDELSTAEHSILPDGNAGLVVLVTEHGGMHHRFVIPTDHPEEVEATIRTLARVHRVHTAAPQQAVARTLTVAVCMATVATLTVLLLSANHILHF